MDNSIRFSAHRPGIQVQEEPILQTRRHKKLMTALNVVPAAALGLVVAASPLLMLSQASSGLPEDRRRAMKAEARAHKLALQAGLPLPHVFVHLSLPLSSLAETRRFPAPYRADHQPRGVSHKIVLHRSVVDDLAPPFLDCILGHELGHVAMDQETLVPVLAQSGQTIAQMRLFDSHQTEYAADWFGAQLCGRDQMIGLLGSDWNRQGGSYNRSTYVQPSIMKRIENLNLSNKSHIHFLETEYTGLIQGILADFCPTQTDRLLEGENFALIAGSFAISLVSLAIFKLYKKA